MLLLPFGFFQQSGVNPYLKLWFDASDHNTLYDSVVGGSLVSSNGGTVKRWEDKSGNGKHLTDATGVTLDTVTNEEWAVKADGTQFMSSTEPHGITNLDEFIFVAVYAFDSYKANAGIFTIGATGSGNGYDSASKATFEQWNHADQINRCIFRNGGGISVNPSTIKSKFFHSCMVRITGGNVTLYWDGEIVGTDTCASQATLDAGFGIFNQYISGAWSASSFKAIARIAEIRVYDSALTTDDVTAIHAELADKWSILGSTWTPALLSVAPSVWIDADAIALANTDPIPTLVDRVGVTHNAYSGNPIMYHSILNSKKAIGFNIASASLTAGLESASSISIARGSMFAVWKKIVNNAGVPYSQFLASHNTVAGSATDGMYVWGFGNQAVWHARSPKKRAGGIATWDTLNAWMTINAGSHSGVGPFLRVNEAEKSMSFLYDAESSDFDASYSSVWHTGGAHDVNFRPRGYIPEMIVLGYDASVKDTLRIHNYLRTKYRHY